MSAVLVETSPALARLLDDQLQLPPEYDAGLASHLPMALIALDGLGADAARLQAFAARYARRLPAGATEDASDAEPLADWPAQRGRFERFAALRAGFSRALAREGRDAVLRQALPLLVTGIGGVAFHGAIRAGHAVDAGHEGELAAALAYWASRWMPLAAPPRGAPAAGVAAWLDALDAALLRGDPAWRPHGRLISDRLVEAAATPAYGELAGRFPDAEPAALLQGLARAAAARFVATRSFTVLHVATTARALQALAPWLPAGRETLAPVWHAVAAASLASQVAARPDRVTVDDGLAWPEVRARACASDDDHVVKFVHAMVAQQARAPGPLWLRAAGVAVADLPFTT